MKIKLMHGEVNIERLSGYGWYLVSIIIENEYRENGIGTKLMGKTLKRCGRPIYLLATDELGGDVFRLKSFYKRFGFVPYKRKRSDGLPYNANMVLYS